MKIFSINPATEEVLKEFDLLELAASTHACKTARIAQKEWAQQSAAHRSAPAKKLAVHLRENAQKYAKLMTAEMGKPIKQALAEVEKCAWLCDYYYEAAPKHLEPEVIETDMKKSYVRFDPLGVVLGIMPWNFPFWQVIRFAVPVLCSGNVVILKHASNVPQCALALEEAFMAAGYPKHTFTTLLINPATVTQLIEADTLIDAISLTGSTGAGTHIAEVAGKHLKKYVLELGGSDPFIVLADADLEQAAKTAATARHINNGQSCIAAKRFLVDRSVLGKFEEMITAQVKSLTVGDPESEETDIGPLAKKELVDDIERQVNDAVTKGARLLAGGKRREGKGFFYEPTILADVTPEMMVYTQEVFGPSMSIIPVDGVAHAIEVANATEFGLGASVWTQNIETAEKIAARIESGTVAINGMVKSDPRLPFGGTKKSGIGREMGSYGLKEFVNAKTVVVN